MVVAAIAIAGAVFLLGGGLSAQGTVSWKFIGIKSGANSDTTPHRNGAKTHDDSNKHSRGDNNATPPNSGPANKNHDHPQKPKKKKQQHHSQWHPCPNDSAGVQYCEYEPNGDTGEDPTVPTEPESEDNGKQQESGGSTGTIPAG